MKNFYQKKNKRGWRAGFTLVETLVALFVFSISVVAVMVVLGRGISSTTFARDKVIATYLAQEGIEYFRNMRDTFVLYSEEKPKAWADEFVAKLKQDGCDQENGCFFINTLKQGMLIKDVKLVQCGEKCANLSYDGVSYGYDFGNPSSFSRKMFFKELATDQIQVISEVFWINQGRESSVKFSENLTLWVE